jgi:hypothetical protein
VFATLACLGLMLESSAAMRLAAGVRLNVALALTGGALMAHDWKDRELWFERGRGSQA